MQHLPEKSRPTRLAAGLYLTGLLAVMPMVSPVAAAVIVNINSVTNAVTTDSSTAGPGAPPYFDHLYGWNV